MEGLCLQPNDCLVSKIFWGSKSTSPLFFNLKVKKRKEKKRKEKKRRRRKSELVPEGVDLVIWRNATAFHVADCELI